MRIAVIGCGAMGALYGGYLSRNNDVTLVERNPDRIAKIRADGLRIAEPDGSAAVYRPGITGDTSGMAPADLVILFVKSMQSEAALEANRALIGRDTYLMTLQNGSGHEEVLRRFADDARYDAAQQRRHRERRNPPRWQRLDAHRPLGRGRGAA